MKKIFFLLLFIFIGNTFLLGQSRIKGKIVYLNSGKKPAVGVEVRAQGSNGDYSKSDGAYTLIFPQKKVGNTVYLEVGEDIVVRGNKTKKIELVNEKELKTVNIPSDPENAPLKIIVCPKGFRDKYAQKYYKIIKTKSDYLLAKKKKEIASLKEKLGAKSSLIKELQQELKIAEKQNDSLKIYQQAMEIASINKDDASRRLKEYIEALDAGVDIDIAQKILSTKKAYKEALDSKKSIENSIKEIKRKSESLIATFQYKEAIQKLDTICLIYNQHKRYVDEIELLKNIGNWYENEQHNDKKALEYYKKGLKTAEKFNVLDSEGMMLSYIGIFYVVQNQYKEAEDYFIKSLKIYEALAQNRATILNLENQAALCYDLGRLYKGVKNKQALKYTFKALDINRKLETRDGKFKIRTIQTHTLLADIYVSKRDNKNAEKYLDKVLQLKKKIVQDSVRLENFLTEEEIKQFGLYSGLKVLNKQGETLKISFFINVSKAKMLYDVISQKYDKLDIYSQFKFLFYTLNFLENTDFIYKYETEKEAKDILLNMVERYDELRKKINLEDLIVSEKIHSDKEAYTNIILNNIVSSINYFDKIIAIIKEKGVNSFDIEYEELKNITISKDNSNNTLQDIRILAGKNPKRYNKDLAKMLLSEAKKILVATDKLNAELYFKEALYLYKKIASEDPRYNNKVLEVYRSIVQFYYSLKEENEVLKTMEESYLFYKKLDSIGYPINVKHKIEIIYSLAEIYEDKKEYTKAEKYYLSAYNRLGKLHSNEKDIVLEQFYIREDLGHFYYFSLNNSKLAEDFYLQALEIADKYPDLDFSLGLIFNILGDLKEGESSYDKALHYYQKALKEYRKLVVKFPNSNYWKEQIETINKQIKFLEQNVVYK